MGMCSNFESEGGWKRFREAEPQAGDVSVDALVGLYTVVFLCVCVCSLYVLVGPVQGAPSVWAHVRPAVGRPPGRLWQREDTGVLWSQYSQRLLLFLQVLGEITAPKHHADPNRES